MNNIRDMINLQNWFYLKRTVYSTNAIEACTTGSRNVLRDFSTLDGERRGYVAGSSPEDVLSAALST